MNYKRGMVVYHQPVIHHCAANTPVPVREGVYVFKCGMKIGGGKQWILMSTLFKLLQKFFHLLRNIFRKCAYFMNPGHIVMALELAGTFPVINIAVFIKCAAG